MATRPNAGGNFGRVGDRLGERKTTINNQIAIRSERHTELQNRMSDYHVHQHRPDAIDPDYGVRPHPGYGYWHGWHHGCWGGCWGSWWDHMWTYHPVATAFGLTMWGINRATYWYGYDVYYNPYYTGPVTSTAAAPIDYSQPISTYDDQATEKPPSVDAQMAAVQVFNKAREDFYAGRYDEALTRVNKALAAMPGDPVMNEFRALALFAQGNFPAAAANIHSVLAVGPGWDYTTLMSLYPSASVYQQQLGRLEDFVIAHDDSAPEHFLLAYHYMTEGHTAAAARHFRRVIEVEPKDVVAKQLLEMVAGPESVDPQADPAPAPAEGDGPQIAAADLVGTWTAQGTSGESFMLVLDDAGKFTWTYTSGSQATSVEGVYAIDGVTLAMEPDAGGVMVAEVSPPTDGKFHFQVVGGPPGDKGLAFSRSDKPRGGG